VPKAAVARLELRLQILACGRKRERPIGFAHRTIVARRGQ
jgi:hypothetical protein